MTGATVAAGGLPVPAPAGHPSTVDGRGVDGPAEALAELIAGNRRFASRQPKYGHDVAAAAAASGGQQPFAVVVGCIDSRVPLEAVFDQDFGCICVVRSGGVVLDRAVIGSVEFAVTELGAPLVMVLGHERCGAVAAAVTALRGGPRPAGALGYLVDAIAPAVRQAGPHTPDAERRALRLHVRHTVERLAGAVRTRPTVVGAVYDLDTGRVDLLD